MNCLRLFACFGVIAIVSIGCGQRFESESEELAYLRRISNPTPEQFRRQKQLEELELKVNLERIRQAEQDRIEWEKNAPKREAEAARRKLDERQEIQAEYEKRILGETEGAKRRIGFLRDEAKKDEEKGDFKRAASWYSDLVDEFPKIPDRAAIDRRIEELKAKAR